MQRGGCDGPVGSARQSSRPLLGALVSTASAEIPEGVAMTKRPRRADSSSDAPREALRPKSSKLLHRDATSSSGSGDSGSDGCGDTSAAALVRSSERTEPPGILLQVASDIIVAVPVPVAAVSLRLLLCSEAASSKWWLYGSARCPCSRPGWCRRACHPPMLAMARHWSGRRRRRPTFNFQE